MKITIFQAPNRTDTIRLEEHASLGGLWSYFQNHTVYQHETKNGKTPSGSNPDLTGYVPPGMSAFSPAEYDGTSSQSKTTGQWAYNTSDANVLRIHFGVLDFDKITPDKLAEVLRRFDPVHRILYSTYSHGRAGGVGCYRLVFPFTRAVEVKEWAHCWAGMTAMVEGWNDQKCFDPRRLYYFPATVRGRDQYKSVGIWGGQAVNVDALIQIGAGVIKAAKNSSLLKHERAQVLSVGITDIHEMASELRRRKSEYCKDMGKRIKEALAGRVFYAPDGERDGWLWKLAGHLAEFFPHGDPLSMAEHFRVMLGRACAAYASGDPNVDYAKLIEKIQRQQRDYLEKKGSEESKREGHQRFLMREAFSAVHLDREHPYSTEDIARYSEDAKVDPQDFHKRLIIQRGKSHYVFVDGHYLPPIGENAFSASCLRDLAPAVSMGVHLFNDKGKPKAPKDLVAEYGTVARNSIVDMTATHTRYEPTSQTVVEASCPLRELEPKRNVIVETWLKFLGGDKVELLLDWISVITRLDRPCTILYLCGPKSIGKTSLGEGLSRLWTTEGPTPMGKVFAEFNQSLSVCPLVVANEKLPKELRGEPSTALRDFMDQTSRKLSRKFLDDSQLIGATRVILTANNPNLLQTGESLSTDDLDALSQRLLFIRPDPQAEKFMQALANAGIDFREMMTKSDVLAQHALWLKETRAIHADNGRYFVHDIPDNELSNDLACKSGQQSRLCHWLVSYLQRPAQWDDAGSGLIIRQDGCLLVSGQAIHDGWGVYMREHRCPSAEQIGEGLQALSESPARIIPQKTLSAQYFPIRVELLIHWAKTKGFSSEQEIRHALMKETKLSDVDKVAVNLYNEDNKFRKQERDKEMQLGLWRQKQRQRA